MNSVANSALVRSSCLIEVGEWLRSTGYSFTTPTPATHQRVNQRVNARHAATQPQSLRDVFGWNRAFDLSIVPTDIAQAMEAAGLLQHTASGTARSLVRFSSLDSDLYAHSAFPTDGADAVFFGPDTYRFAALIHAELEREALRPGARILDVGCGAGPGGIVAMKAARQYTSSLTLGDINEAALQFSCANAALAKIEATLALGDLFEPVGGEFDFIVSNPPYLNDSAERTYRHGGGEWGAALSQRIVREGLERLAPGGRLVLYTGAAIVDGRDPFIESLRSELNERGWPWRYRELDPDVFGEELELPAYAEVERIAAVALIVTRPA